MNTLMILAAFCYFLAMIKYFLHLAIKRKALYILANTMVGLGFALHTVMLFTLSAKTGHGPYTNPFEYTSFFAWTTMGALLAAVIFYRVTTIGIFISPIGLLLMATSILLQQPAKDAATEKAFWLTMHFTVSFLALSSFVVVFAASIMYLIQERQLKKHAVSGVFSLMPPLDKLDAILNGSLVFGFPLITVGVCAGIIMSLTRFGTWFGPEPYKVIPVLLVWFIYGLLVMGRSVYGWRGHLIAIIGAIGFASAVVAVTFHIK